MGVTAISLQHVRSPALPMGINCKEVLRFDAIFHDSIVSKLPLCLEHHPNARVALGVNVAALHKDWFCSTTGSSQAQLMVEIITRQESYGFITKTPPLSKRWNVWIGTTLLVGMGENILDRTVVDVSMFND